VNLLRRIRARLHAWWRALLDEHASPGRLAAAVFVGVVAGCTPFFGLHLLLCIALALLFRLNKVTVYAAANISIPPMIPLLGFLSVQAGSLLLHRRFLSLAIADFRSDFKHMLGLFFLDWLVGSLLVGALLGAGLAAAAYRIAVARRAAAADPVLAAIARASRRYDAAPRRLRMYARWKYRLDPCYREIAPLIPDGAFTVDLGTGMGMLPLVLAELPGERRVLGVDWDAPKLAAGCAAASGLAAVSLVDGDARSFALPPCDAITLVDVLHYYDAPAQRALLERCAAALREGGSLLVREADRSRRGGAWTRFIEWLAVRIGWNLGEGRPKFRPLDDLRKDMESLGFQVSVAAVAGRLHPGNVLLIARKLPPD
jgi:uncharacterized protein (DUF2062 family)/SAM-dependent methyltransferase